MRGQLTALVLLLSLPVIAAEQFQGLQKKTTKKKAKRPKKVAPAEAPAETTPGVDLTKPDQDLPAEDVPAEDPDSPSVTEVAPPAAGPRRGAPILVVALGAGATFRTLQAGASTVPVPRAPAAMLTLGATLQFFPLRLVEALDDRAFSDLSVEGSYRQSVVQAAVSSGSETTVCPASDDELVGRVGYRHRFHPKFPRVGLAFGVTSETTSIACETPVLSTSYQATELQLRLLQPFFDERLTLELAGGPRFLFSTRAAGFTSAAYSVDGWLTFRPVHNFVLRAGARVTGTQLTTWPEGTALNDTRVMAALEVGGAL